MKNSKSQISETEVLTKNIVFVDGITRVGKTMLCNVLAYIRNVSPSQMIDPLEQLLPMYATGHIDRNAVSAFLRSYFKIFTRQMVKQLLMNCEIILIFFSL